MATKVVNNVPNFSVNATIQWWTDRGWDFASDSVARTIMSRRHTLIFTKPDVDPEAERAEAADYQRGVLERAAARRAAWKEEAAAAASLEQPTYEHGTVVLYRDGCRCRECKTAWAERKLA